MTRISSLAANQLLISKILQTQSNVHERQLEVSSGKISQTYNGLATETQRLVNMENTVNEYEKFMQNNEILGVQLDITSIVHNQVREEIENFSETLLNLATFNTRDQTKIEDTQREAFRTLKSIESYLNTEINGQYLFAGSRTTTQPVDFGLTTVADFQADFDGISLTTPTTRDANLENYSFSADSGTGAVNWLDFARDTGTGTSRVTSTSADFANVTVGSTINISGTGGVNDGLYTVAAVGGGGTTLDIVTQQFTDEVAVATTITYPDPDDTNDTITTATTMTFDQATNTVTYTPDDLDALPVGSAFTVSGSASNDGSYTVTSINTATDTITISPRRFTDQGSVGNEYFAPGALAVTFADNTPSADTLTAAAGTFQDAAGNNLPSGTSIVITGTGQDGTYTIDSVSADGSTATLIATDTLVAEVAGATTMVSTLAAGTIESMSYYNGDEIVKTHRVDTNRTINLDLTAVDPAYEKAIRAMLLILQGGYGTAGGLDQNMNRVGEARFLVKSSIDKVTTGTPPFGTELTANLTNRQLSIAFDNILIEDATQIHTRISGFLRTSIGDIENANPTEAITNLLNQQTSLEASFQVYSRISQLSLTNYL